MRCEAIMTVFVVAGLFAASSARGGDPAPDPAAAAKGQTTYVRYCVSCHGPAGKGDGPLAGDLKVPVPDLRTMATRAGGQYPYDRVVRIVRSGEIVRGHGTVDMPAWGDVFKKTKGTEEATIDTAVRNLSHYLWSIQLPAKQPGVAGTPWFRAVPGKAADFSSSAAPSSPGATGPPG
jgi:mono/diheme cytochrome c family protein